MTPNGKLNRQALLNMAGCAVLRKRPHVPPHGGHQEVAVAEMFKRVLRLEEIGRDDHFFEIGGDSLSALEVIFTAEQIGVRLTMDLLREATIKELAECDNIDCETRANESTSASTTDLHQIPQCRNAEPMVVPARRVDNIPIIPNQLWLLERGFEKPAAYAFSAWLRSNDVIDGIALSKAWKAIHWHHEALRICFQDGDRISHNAYSTAR